MRVTTFFSLVFFFVLLACSDAGSVKQAITKWELKQNNCIVLEFIGVDSMHVLYFADSAVILEQEYQQLKFDKFNSLNTQLASIEQRMELTQNKIDSTDNELMRRAIRNKLYELEIEKQQCKGIIEVYKNKPDQTSFNRYEHRIQAYLKEPNKVAAYLQSAQFVRQQGQLTVDTALNVYVFDADKLHIFGYYEK